MKRVNKKLAAGIFLLSQTLSGAAFAASVTLAGIDRRFQLRRRLAWAVRPGECGGR